MENQKNIKLQKARVDLKKNKHLGRGLPQGHLARLMDIFSQGNLHQ